MQKCVNYILMCSFLQPLESKLISETSGLFEANHVAKVILTDAVVSEQFFSRYLMFLVYGLGNTVKENSSVFFLIQVHYLPSQRACGH